MSPAVAEIRGKVTDAMRRRGVVRASIFGSVARGDGGPDSDIDFLVEFEKGRSLVNLSGLEVIGEAVKGLPADLRDRHPEIPWRDIAGARDVLIHEYFRIDVELAWKMAREDVPELAAKVAEIVDALGDD